MGVNVASGQITGTTTAMQYSVDSTNGTDGNWTTASATTTPVTFTPGNVYVRQTAEPTSFRLVATIAAAATAPTGIGINVAAGQITGTKATQQYSLDGGTTWDDATETNTPVTFVAGNSVVVREKATASALASASTTPITVAAPVAAPTATIVKGSYGSTTKLTGLTRGLTYEYVVDTNAILAGDAANWAAPTSITLSSTEIDNIPVILGQYIHLRVKATEGKLASEVQNSAQLQSDEITSYAEAVEKDRERLVAPFPTADRNSPMSIPGPAYGSNITWEQGSSTGGASATFDVGRGTFQVHGNSGSTVTIVATITQGTATATKDIVITIK